LEGRISDLSDDNVNVKSEDGKSELLLNLHSVVCFGSADAGQSVGAVGLEFGLVALLEDPEDAENPESVSFVERVPE
jgi:hypothetical protein